MHKDKKSYRYEAKNEKPVEKKPFKFVYIDPASMTHDWFLYEMPKGKEMFEAFDASGNGRFISPEQIKMENIVPLK